MVFCSSQQISVSITYVADYLSCRSCDCYVSTVRTSKTPVCESSIPRFRCVFSISTNMGQANSKKRKRMKIKDVKIENNFFYTLKEIYKLKRNRFLKISCF